MFPAETPFEEFLGSTEFARAVASTLDRATTHPITVRRELGDVTIVHRADWQRGVLARRYQEIVLSLTTATVRRAMHADVHYPAELHWLAWLEDDDYLEFCEEFTIGVRDVSNGRAEPLRLTEILHAWEQSAYALRDPHLMRRVEAKRDRT